MKNIKRTQHILAVIAVLTMSFFLTMGMALAATAQTDAVVVKVNGKQVDSLASTIGGHTVVALRSLAEDLGATVIWNASQNKVTVQLDQKTVELSLGTTTAKVNGQNTALPIAAKIVKGQLVVPIRFLTEALGATIQWDKSSRTALVLTGTGSEQGATSDLPLFVQADTVQGGANVDPSEIPLKVCVQQNRFARNEQIVWRIRVLDPKTGKAMDDQELAAVTINIGGSTGINARFGPHPHIEPTDAFWSASWIVPSDYPTGNLDYSITVAAKDGREGSFLPFKVAPSQVAITEK